MKIKDAFHSIKNGANIKQDKSSGGIPITRIETIVNNKFNFERLGYSGINDETFSNYYLKEGDILMSHINSVSHLGKVAIFENRQEKIIHGMNLLCLKANTNIVLPKYAYYFFRSPLFISSLIKITKKSVNQASFNISNLEKIKIQLPEKLEDQIRIATILTQVENLIKQRKESIDLLDEFLKSTFLKMFGDSLRNENKWEKTILDKIASQITDGEHSTPVRIERGIKLLSARNIKDGYIDFNAGLDYISESEYNRIAKRCKPEKNDILMSCSGSVGRVCVINIDEPLSLVRSVALIKPIKNKINSNYLQYWMQSIYFQNEVKKSSKTSSQSNIFTGAIKKLPVIVPPLLLQKQFAIIVEKAEVLKKEFKESLNELENLFGSLSQRAFKGELDLSALSVLVEEEEYHSSTNDRTEPYQLPNNKIIVEVPEENITSVITTQMQKFIKSTDELSKMIPNTSAMIKLPAIYEKLWPQIEQVSKMMAPFEKLTRLPESVSHAMKTFESIKSISLTLQEDKKTENSRITWEEVNFQQVSNWIKNKYDGFHFNSEMLIRFLIDEHVTFPNYYSSEELKTNPKLSEADDIKSFIFSALNNENPFIKLNQVFYDSVNENIDLDLHEEDYKLIKDKEKSERSGIYFKIIE